MHPHTQPHYIPSTKDKLIFLHTDPSLDKIPSDVTVQKKEKKIEN